MVLCWMEWWCNVGWNHDPQCNVWWIDGVIFGDIFCEMMVICCVE